MHCENPLASLDFVAFTKADKHKMRSEGFSTTWPNLFSNTFATVRVASFVSICFSHDRIVTQIPKTSSSLGLSSPPSPTHAFVTGQNKGYYRHDEDGSHKRVKFALRFAIVVVKKNDNSKLIYMDYRRLNKLTVFDPEPMPTGERLFQK